MTSLRLGRNRVICPSVLRRLKKRNFDVVILGVYSTPTQILASLWMRILRRPYVLNADGGFIKKEGWLSYKIKHFLISGAKWWLSSGEKTNQYLLHYGAAPESIFTYPFTSLSQKDLLQKPLGREAKNIKKSKLGITGKLVLSVGTFEYRKGFDILLRVWEESGIEGSNLALIGGGPEKERYEAIIQELGLERVYLIDFQDKNNVLEWYRAADLFVFPTRYDIWGLAVNEALSQGLPVIASTEALSAQELIQEGVNGYMVPDRNVKTFSKYIREILSDNSLGEKLSRQSIELIQPYTIENMALKHIDLFKKVKKGGKSA